jgi:hypothetical protein
MVSILLGANAGGGWGNASLEVMNQMEAAINSQKLRRFLFIRVLLQTGWWKTLPVWSDATWTSSGTLLGQIRSMGDGSGTE